MKTDKQPQKEFDRVSNTPSPNPRYGGKTPLELARMLLRPNEAGQKAKPK